MENLKDYNIDDYDFVSVISKVDNSDGRGKDHILCSLISCYGSGKFHMPLNTFIEKLEEKVDFKSEEGYHIIDITLDSKKIRMYYSI